MHSKSIWRAMLLTALVAFGLAAGAAHAQPQQTGEDYAPADPVWPFPLYSTHPEEGGLYVASEFVSYRQTNPLKSQEVAFRGLFIVDPDTVFRGARQPFPLGQFLGSGQQALNTGQVSNGNDFQPGVKAVVGWKFADGSAFSISYLFITEVNLGAAATLNPAGFDVGANFANTFLSAPVFNYPNDYNGVPRKISTDLPDRSSVPGIWNGAGIMTEQFLQRTQEWEGTYRMPIFDSENYRINGMVGPRLTWIWERYKWTTTDIDVNGASGPQFQAIYTNIVSNRLYGAFVGCQQEWYIGHGFAAHLDVNGALYADSIKTRAKYELATKFAGPQAKRARHMWRIAPEAQATVGLMWYPIEGVQIHAGYDFQAFFNTMSSHYPIDFNYGSVDPGFQSNTVRFLDGMDIGIALIF